MDALDLPITGQALLTLAGMVAFCIVMVQWLKSYVIDSRWVNLIALGVALAVSYVATLIENGGITGSLALQAFLLGFFSASVATMSYETVSNLLGKLGVGDRSDTAQLAKANALTAANTTNECTYGCDCKRE